MTARLTVAVASRALFNLEEEHAVYERDGLGPYTALQAEREMLHPDPGPAYALVDALSRINGGCDPLSPLVNLIVVSRNGPMTGMRFLNGVRGHGLGATRAMMTGGRPIVPHLKSVGTDLFLTRSHEDAEAAARAGVPVALLAPGSHAHPFDGEVRVAFDGDAVLYDDASERAFESGGYESWMRQELERTTDPLGPGPLAPFAHKLNALREDAGRAGVQIRLALVTARDGNARHRAIATLRHWGLDMDEAYFLGGMSKADILANFRPHLFMDDREHHVAKASPVAPAGLVPRISLDQEEIEEQVGPRP